LYVCDGEQDYTPQDHETNARNLAGIPVAVQMFFSQHYDLAYYWARPPRRTTSRASRRTPLVSDWGGEDPVDFGHKLVAEKLNAMYWHPQTNGTFMAKLAGRRELILKQTQKSEVEMAMEQIMARVRESHTSASEHELGPPPDSPARESVLRSPHRSTVASAAMQRRATMPVNARVPGAEPRSEPAGEDAPMPGGEQSDGERESMRDIS